MTTQGQGMTSYIDAVADQISAITDPDDPILSDRYRVLYRQYALLALTTGTHTTLEDVHDAWAVWCLTDRPDHYSLVAFEELSADVQAKDQPYVDAIRQVARPLASRKLKRAIAKALTDIAVLIQEPKGDPS